MNKAEIIRLVEESEREGYRHLRRLIDVYESGANRFGREGEALFAAVMDGEVIGIGGLNRDHCDRQNAPVGRVRRVYVSQLHRRSGAGRRMMGAVLELARQHYDYAVLRTSNPEADRFYRSLGFSARTDDARVTHEMKL
ncbi:GNAT family N-acetyltransferase [Paenibacillus sp. sptzw28]|uniref:GNAT family N-acetyltransferase n=1 Tax=Paenibacillus sp. sptzw28 TaxID=715179 RepID=UPI001C6F50E8|nr:GNAT family N-acetyltransferase [Paenibacillus sp. sptzw28]QYR21287.1 GNAT family N-acetyltransferase [Paenibacillus sp. sptzw28]